MEKYNQEKKDQLGMPFGTAMNILRKNILFNLVGELNKLQCFQCGMPIKEVSELSIEHKSPWLHKNNAKELFFDINNIAFSHLKCNVGARRKIKSPEFIQLICAKCGKEFTRRIFGVRHKMKMGQVDFYCTRACAGRDSGKGYGRIK